MRISTLQEKMNSVKNSSLVCLFFVFIFSISVFSLCTNSYAMDYVTVPDSDTSTQVIMNAYPGCIYNNYNIGNNDVEVPFYAGGLMSDLVAANNLTTDTYNSYVHNCGYRIVNNKYGYYRFSPVYRYTMNIATDGTYTTSTSGGSTSGLGNFSSYSDSAVDFHASLHDLSIKVGSSTNDTGFIPLWDSTSLPGVQPRVLYLFGIDFPLTVGSGEWASMTNFYISSFSNSGINDSIEALTINNNDSNVKYCYNDYSTDDIIAAYGEDTYNTFQDFFDRPLASNYWRCTFMGSIRMYEEGRLQFQNGVINIDPAPASYYSKNNFLAYNLNNRNLSNYGYPWDYLMYGPSYSSMSSFIPHQFDFSDPVIYFAIPTTEEDVLNNQRITNGLFTTNSSTANGNEANDVGTDDMTPPNSAIQEWFNVFGGAMNVLFPFSNFFTGFINPSSCASVPIIASWVHSPNSTYCSWWPNNVIGTLTPVFVLVSNMILFGFIMSWLRGDRAYSIFKEDRSDT